jgi:hypothetical protein
MLLSFARSFARALSVRAAAPVLRLTLAALATAAAPVVLAASPMLAGCEDDTGEKKGPVTAVDPAEQARIDQGKQLMKDANDAMGEKNYDKARKLLAQATALNNESQRFEIAQSQETLDKRQAKLWANEVDESFKSKDCAGAFKQLAEPLKTLSESEAFMGELRHLVGNSALHCVQDALDKKVTAGDYAGARAAAGTNEVKLLLGPVALKKLSAEVEATIFEALRLPIDADVKARRWPAAVQKIEAAAKKGDATDEQVDALLGSVRAGVSPEIASLAGRAVGQRDAGKALKDVDQLIRLVRWAVLDPGVAALEAGTALPEDLAKKREALAIWVEAQRLAMRPLPKPEMRWAHGKVDVFAASRADAPSKSGIAHGTQIWILGATKDRALVTTADPGSSRLVDVLDKVTGWVATDRLAKEATLDWLVPDDQLKGQRVWGPLRPPDAMWELGLVVDVSGRDISVQRLADGAPFKLTRQKLRSGRLAPGTRVLTFCREKDQPAKVVEVPPTARTAKLKCDGGEEKEEDLATLRSKPELLPPTK